MFLLTLELEVFVSDVTKVRGFDRIIKHLFKSEKNLVVVFYEFDESYYQGKFINVITSLVSSVPELFKDRIILFPILDGVISMDNLKLVFQNGAIAYRVQIANYTGTKELALIRCYNKLDK